MKKNYKLTSLVLMLFVVFNTAKAQTTYYVSIGGDDANDGSSWGKAFRNLTTALWAGASTTVPASVIINVAAGTYKPDEGTPFGTGRDATFKVYRAEYFSSSTGKSLKLYGGFDAVTGKRDIGSNKTILSGDIGVQGDNSDNVYHIAAIADMESDADSIVVDGFTIRDGNANGTGTYALNPNLNIGRYQGGGFYLTFNSQNDKIAFRHCIFTSNAGIDGGGLYYDASIVSMDACVFYNNSASGIGGGAIRSNSEGKSIVTNSIFFNNSGQFGSAILDGASSSSITNSTFTDNVGNNGCITAFGSTILVANNIIYGNQSSLYNSGGTINAASNIIQGGFAGTGNINADPLFADAADKDGADNTWGTADDGLRPNVCSPAVNAGSNDADKVLTAADITDAKRIQNTTVDMGAYELSESPKSVTYYRDVDQDGFGNEGDTKAGTECSIPNGYIGKSGDCDDNDKNINPNTVWVLDNDNDGYYKGSAETQCASPGTGYLIKTNQQSGDCDDNDASINSGTVWVLDSDNDGYYTGDPVTQCASPGTGYVIKTNQQSGDCDDNDKNINPNTVWVLDNDHDSYYTGDPVTQCASPGTGYIIKTTQQAGDCADNDAAINPGAIEICGNGIDDNCNDQIDEGCSTCANATGLTTSNITSSGAKLNWTASVNPAQWQVQYMALSAARWKKIRLTGSARSVNISSLMANRNYRWRIRAKCGTTWTHFSAIVNFKTRSAAQINTITQQAASVKNETEDKSPAIKLYPNPTRGQFVLELHLPGNINANAKIQLINMMGQTVSTDNASINNGTLYKNMSILSSLASGIYVARIIVNNKTYQARVVYEK